MCVLPITAFIVRDVPLCYTSLITNQAVWMLAMKRGFIIVGECILLIIVLLAATISLGNCISGISDNDAVNFVFFCLAGLGSVLMYRKNTRK